MEGERTKEPFIRRESAPIYGLVALAIAAVLFVTGSSLVEAVGATVIAFAVMFAVFWVVGLAR